MNNVKVAVVLISLVLTIGLLSYLSLVCFEKGMLALSLLLFVLDFIMVVVLGVIALCLDYG